MDFAILGAGRWGTALAGHLLRLGHRVFLFDKNQEAVEKIKRGVNPYFEGHYFEGNVSASTDLRGAEEFENILCALPAQAVRKVFSKLQLGENRVINASKGLEIDTFKRVSEVIKELHPSVMTFALSGPSFAKEVAEGKPTAVVLAYDQDKDDALELQKNLNSENFRVYISSDLPGVELGGALKNVIAIACGISDGLGYGHNARAGLITRGLVEMIRIGTALGAKRETFFGLSGLGDLVLTATSDLSRNRTLGLLVGKGMPVSQALEEIGQTVEGYRTVLPLYRLAEERRIYAPITEAVYKVLYENHDVRAVVEEMLTRPPGEESI